MAPLQSFRKVIEIPESGQTISDTTRHKGRYDHGELPALHFPQIRRVGDEAIESSWLGYKEMPGILRGSKTFASPLAGTYADDAAKHPGEMCLVGKTDS